MGPGEIPRLTPYASASSGLVHGTCVTDVCFFKDKAFSFQFSLPSLRGRRPHLMNVINGDKEHSAEDRAVEREPILAFLGWGCGQSSGKVPDCGFYSFHCPPERGDECGGPGAAIVG